MSVFSTGDNHGGHSIMKLSHSNWKEGAELTSDDYVIIDGDFGLLFNNVQTRDEAYFLKWLAANNWTTLVVDGNHENHPKLYALPQKQWHGGTVGIIADNILHLRRGEIYDIDDRKYFTFGGARSEDKMYRKEFISWWSEEIPSYEEMKHGIDTLTKNHWKVDYIISHTAPFSIIENHMEELNIRSCDHYSLVDYFDIIKDQTDFTEWRFGHFHVDKKLDDKFTAQYHSIIKF